MNSRENEAFEYKGQGGAAASEPNAEVQCSIIEPQLPRQTAQQWKQGQRFNNGREYEGKQEV